MLKCKGELDETTVASVRPSTSRTPRLKLWTTINQMSLYVKCVTKVIGPLAGQTISFVENSHHFVEQIKDETIRVDEVMVSFDVKSLFTNVPLDEALQVIQTKDASLREGTALSTNNVTHLLELCLRSTYFSFEEELYK